MAKVYLDLFLCLFTYVIMIYLIFWRKNKSNRSNDKRDDDDGGIPVYNGPELDLPPGVCLPSDPLVLKRRLEEDVLA